MGAYLLLIFCLLSLFANSKCQIKWFCVIPSSVEKPNLCESGLSAHLCHKALAYDIRHITVDHIVENGFGNLKTKSQSTHTSPPLIS